MDFRTRIIWILAKKMWIWLKTLTRRLTILPRLFRKCFRILPHLHSIQFQIHEFLRIFFMFTWYLPQHNDSWVVQKFNKILLNFFYNNYVCWQNDTRQAYKNGRNRHLFSEYPIPLYSHRIFDNFGLNIHFFDVYGIFTRLFSPCV